MKRVADFLEGKVVFTDAITYKALGMFPVLEAISTKDSLKIWLLEEALKKNAIQITEVGEVGEVPYLSVVNKGPIPILILEGEEFVGGKQNRIANTSILISAHTTVKIPVSCIEAGRWHGRRLHFEAGEAMFRVKGRALAKLTVSKSLKSEGEFRSDQQRVWNEVSYSLREVGAESHTQDFRSAREKVYDRAEEYLKRLHPVQGQVGAIFFGPKGIIGMELLESHDLFGKAFQKVLRSFVFEVLFSQEQVAPKWDQALNWWAKVLDAPVEEFPSVSAGKDIRFEGVDFIGSGLIFEDTLIHLSCLHLENREDSEDLTQGGRASVRERIRRMQRRHS